MDRLLAGVERRSLKVQREGAPVGENRSSSQPLDNHKLIMSFEKSGYGIETMFAERLRFERPRRLTAAGDEPSTQGYIEKDKTMKMTVTLPSGGH
jgi:hypothetical protein